MSLMHNSANEGAGFIPSRPGRRIPVIRLSRGFAEGSLIVRLAVVLTCCAALCGGWLPALETDQYYSWGRPLADSTDAVNAS